MPTKRCRECGDDFESEEGRGRLCPSCFLSDQDRDDPIPVDIAMAKHRRFWRWTPED